MNQSLKNEGQKTMKTRQLCLIFFATEYLLKTFVNSFKLHQVGFPAEFCPILLVTAACTILYKPVTHQRQAFKAYLNFIIFSLLGYITADVVLYFQWYWIIAPKYRHIPGDMMEGFGFGMLFLIIGSILIIILSAVLTIAIRIYNRLSISNRKTKESINP